MEDEAKFPFDVKGFQKAVDAMNKSVSSMSDKMANFGKIMQNSVSKGIMAATAKIGALVAGFKSVMKNIPEIGQAFKMASEIISKEFFFPIRTLLMPYLQKMMDWVRDHRALFAKWGTAVADVLKTVISVAKTLWNTLKSVTDILTNSLQRALGTSFKSIDEFVAVLQVKIAFVTLLIGDAIEEMFKKISPTFEYVVSKGTEILKFFTDLASSWLSLNESGDSIGTILDKMYSIFDKIIRIIGDSVTAFFSGLIEPLKNLMTPIDDVCESFQRLLELFGDNNDGLKGAFKWLGGFVGNVLVLGFEELAMAIDTIVVGIRALAQSGKLLKDLFTGDWAALKYDWKHGDENVFKGYDERMKRSKERQSDYLKKILGLDGENAEANTTNGTIRRIYEIDDGIITKRGQVIKLNPDDNIYAFKNANRIKDFLGEHNAITHTFITKNEHNIFNNKNDITNTHISNTNESPRLEIPAIRQSFSAPMNMVFNVTVTEGNAQSAGRQLGLAIQKSFVERLKEQQMLRGY